MSSKQGGSAALLAAAEPDPRCDLPGADGNPLGLRPALIDETHVYRRLVEPPEHLVCFAPTYPATRCPRC